MRDVHERVQDEPAARQEQTFAWIALKDDAGQAQEDNRKGGVEVREWGARFCQS